MFVIFFFKKIVRTLRDIEVFGFVTSFEKKRILNDIFTADDFSLFSPWL